MIRNLLCFLLFCVNATALNTLRDNLANAEPGDFLVAAQSQNFTLLHIYDKNGEKMRIEEITIPTNKVGRKKHGWREWVERNAPYHTSWVIYEIDLETGKIDNFYSYSRKAKIDIANADNFFSKLINLQLEPLPFKKRRKIGTPPGVGRPDQRRFWQPKLVMDGKEVEGADFQAWRTQWPQDGSQLSSKIIDLYIPKDSDKYPAYFPYWLQVSGMVGKAKIRIVDSGRGLKSPKTPLRR